jgi:hypothetical protein
MERFPCRALLSGRKEIPMSTSKSISIGEPIVTVEKTEALRDGWVASGRIAYPIDSVRTNGTVLEFLFKDASSRSEAVHQSLAEIEALADALVSLVAGLRQSEVSVCGSKPEPEPPQNDVE